VCGGREGDYVIVHVGMAISRVDEEEAAQVFAYLDAMKELENCGMNPREIVDCSAVLTMLWAVLHRSVSHLHTGSSGGCPACMDEHDHERTEYTRGSMSRRHNLGRSPFEGARRGRTRQP